MTDNTNIENQSNKKKGFNWMILIGPLIWTTIMNGVDLWMHTAQVNAGCIYCHV